MVVCGLSGLPWVGGSGGLLLEVNVEPGARPRWMVLPHAHGPNVNVKVRPQPQRQDTLTPTASRYVHTHSVKVRPQLQRQGTSTPKVSRYVHSIKVHPHPQRQDTPTTTTLTQRQVDVWTVLVCPANYPGIFSRGNRVSVKLQLCLWFFCGKKKDS